MKLSAIVVCLIACLLTTALYAKSDGGHWCGTIGPELTRYLIKQNEFRGKELRSISPARIQHKDVGDIAVITGSPKTLIQPNPFDLKGKKITFKKNPAGGFDIKVTAGSVSGTQGSAVALDDDASALVNFTSGFSFSYFGTTYNSVFINSDGNLTFKSADNASTARDAFRILSGPPRIAALFLDLDPSAGGNVNVLQSGTKVTITWNGVPEFGKVNSNTFQVNLFKNGNIEIIFSDTVAAKEGITGISPGNTSSSNLRFVNYSSVTNLTGIKTAVLERFASSSDIDYTALVNEFHETHSQDFDFVVIFTDFPVRLEGGEAFAFFSTIQNQIKGIGVSTFNESKTFGSPRIQGMLVMGQISKYKPDPNQEFFRGYSTMEVMSHEAAHRWLFYPEFINNAVRSADLLGFQDAHYSFYVDSDASVMEGNDVADNGNGSYTTVASTEAYSKLDLYLMGFLPPSAVPPFFYVSGNSDKTRLPEVGVTFLGPRVNVNVSQIIQAEGQRVPNSVASQKKFKEAFILFTKKPNAAPADITKLDNIRKNFAAFFKAKTNNKGTLDTSLAPGQP